MKGTAGTAEQQNPKIRMYIYAIYAHIHTGEVIRTAVPLFHCSSVPLSKLFQLKNLYICKKKCTFAASFQYILLCHKWSCWAVRWFASTLPRKPLSIPLHKVAAGPRDTVVVPAASLSTSYPTAMNCWQLRAKAYTTLPRRDAVGHRDTRAAPAVSFNA